MKIVIVASFWTPEAIPQSGNLEEIRNLNIAGFWNVETTAYVQKTAVLEFTCRNPPDETGRQMLENHFKKTIRRKYPGVQKIEIYEPETASANAGRRS